jgi:hypothetical protein
VDRGQNNTENKRIVLSYFRPKVEIEQSNTLTTNWKYVAVRLHAYCNEISSTKVI